MVEGPNDWEWQVGLASHERIAAAIRQLTRESIERGEAPIAATLGPNRSWRWQSPKARLQRCI